MKRSGIKKLMVVGQVALGLIYFCLTPLYATTALAGILYGLSLVPWLAESMTWTRLIILSPIVYVTWLNTFLISCAIEMQVWRLLFGYSKPRRAVSSDGFRQGMQLYLAIATYLRAYVVWSLPLTRAYMVIPGLRKLVMLSYSTSAKAKLGSSIFGLIYDPDLSEIDVDVILVPVVLFRLTASRRPRMAALCW